MEKKQSLMYQLYLNTLRLAMGKFHGRSFETTHLRVALLYAPPILTTVDSLYAVCDTFLASLKSLNVRFSRFILLFEGKQAIDYSHLLLK